MSSSRLGPPRMFHVKHHHPALGRAFEPPPIHRREASPVASWTDPVLGSPAGSRNGQAVSNRRPMSMTDRYLARHQVHRIV